MSLTDQPPASSVVTPVASSASDVTILAANANRKMATFFNASSAILYLLISTGTSSTTNYSVQIAAGAYFELPLCQGGVYLGVVKGIWASANAFVYVTEYS